MKAIVCEKPHDFQWKEHPKPVPREGESLVKIRQIGICGTDLHAFNGRQPFFSYPRVLGHELAGIIEKIEGPDHGLQAGDRVVIVPYLECGTCVACRNGKTNCCTYMQVIGVHQDGGMREWITLPTDHLIKTDSLSWDEMALVECLSIGAHAVRRALVETGEHVLVVGAGPIGLGAMQFAKLSGAKVIAMDINEARLEYCRNEMGVEYTVNAGIQAREELQQITDGMFPNVVMDATGNAQAMRKSLDYLAHGGRMVYIGLFDGDFSLNDPEFHKRETTLLSSRNATKADFQQVIASMENKQAKSSCLITHHSEFADLIENFQDWLKPESGVVKAMVHL
ncbi:MAG: zinc-binding alcohol dehydrogenase family protein [SAR324 cluster bacterium]|nr:zinc-binding alcohol dehydrogenase family protein [SAR324 cluster bacterium]